MISIAVVEDIEEIREPMFQFLQSQNDFLALFAAESVEEFFKTLDPDIPPDVILLDIGLPGISGLGAIKLIKERIPNSEIIMLTVFDDANKIFQAISSGASGYLLKNTSLEKIKESVIEVHNGGAQMSSSIARKVFNYFNKSVPKESEYNLSNKEKEIVAQIVDGLSYKMIAANLGNSIETIKTHAKNIYKKLQVNSKAEVIAKSLRGEI